jgi:hypothetical protein
VPLTLNIITTVSTEPQEGEENLTPPLFSRRPHVPLLINQLPRAPKRLPVPYTGPPSPPSAQSLSLPTAPHSPKHTVPCRDGRILSPLKTGESLPGLGAVPLLEDPAVELLTSRNPSFVMPSFFATSNIQSSQDNQAGRQIIVSSMFRAAPHLLPKHAHRLVVIRRELGNQPAGGDTRQHAMLRLREPRQATRGALLTVFVQHPCLS